MTLQCKLEGCNSTAVNRLVKGYCMMHYTRLRKTGETGPSVKYADSWGNCYKQNCSKKAGPTGACRQHWHAKNSPNKGRNRSLKLKGLNQEQYEQLLTQQSGGCAICGVKEPGHKRKNFAIDHDHSCCPDTVKHCGKCFRGLLCTRCNLVLGEVNDSVALLQNMVAYLTAPTPMDLLD